MLSNAYLLAKFRFDTAENDRNLDEKMPKKCRLARHAVDAPLVVLERPGSVEGLSPASTISGRSPLHGLTTRGRSPRCIAFFDSIAFFTIWKQTYRLDFELHEQI